MKHTPGPWVVEDSRKLKNKKLRSEMLMVVAAKGGMPGLIVNSGTVTKTDEANARLIASAPELLSLLIEIRKWMDEDDNGPWDGMFCQAIDNALKRALGWEEAE
jgi:hypothetical protein